MRGGMGGSSAGFASLIVLSGAALAADLPGNWALEVTQDTRTYETFAVLAQGSTQTIADEYASKQVRPQLEFRCVPGSGVSIAVRLDWRRFISSFNTEVGFKVDDKELMLVNWGVDRSNRITMPRGESDTRELIEYLSGGERLQVEVIPYSESLITIEYDIAGIDAGLAALEGKCAN